jgi:hypothetical protein
LATAVSSSAEICEHTDDASISSTNWLVSAGYTRSIAGSSTTCQYTWRRLRARHSAASSWPLWMESKPARMISVA